MNQSRQLGDLSPEIHRAIFSFLSWTSKYRMGDVSKYWRKLAKDVIEKRGVRYTRLEYKISCTYSEIWTLQRKILKLQSIDNGVCDSHVIYRALAGTFAINAIIIILCLIWYSIIGGVVATVTLVITSIWFGGSPWIVVTLCPYLKKLRITRQMEHYKNRLDRLWRNEDVLSRKLQNLYQTGIKVWTNKL